ncbi:TROVE domain-containing protein [Schlesneria sp. T3-172]|uniref:TROVE domain-containing protein n=1 Tax=Schlesneria sphaerica TaxID=3373610 RepID=UPI0037C6A770
MANKSLFSSLTSLLPRATSQNDAGGPAYALDPKHALAQLAATGCFNGTFYADADKQLDTLKLLVTQVNDNVFLAKLAIYSRERAYLKDMPAALAATLVARDAVLFHKVFDRVVDNGRVLRTLFQMIRSGQFGKKSLSSSLQRAFQRWLNTASPEKLLSASIGHDPSLRDILRLARPTPVDNGRRALFGWLTDKEQSKWAPAGEVDLPEQVQLLVAFRTVETAEQQIALLDRLHARWDLLADTAKGSKVWAAIAQTMGPQALRMNLNTLQRHGVFEDIAMVRTVADRLADENEIRRSRQFPYQFFAAYLNASDEVPQVIKSALHKATEIACGNVPELPGPVVIGLDVSGSMQSPVTGNRGRGGTSKMRCVDVAALVAAAILRRNPDSIVVPFDTQAFDAKVDPSDSILSLADRLAKYGGGGTDCSLPIRKANATYAKRKFAGVVLVSDNESWVYQGRPYFYGANGSTGVVTEWQRFVQNQVRLHGGDITGPKLICVDLQPNATTQTPERSDILNVGGFSDAVFEVISAFLTSDAARFVAEVEAVTL